MSDDPSVGDLLAGFGGDTEALTDYFCGQIDEDGNPTEYYDGPDAVSDEYDGHDVDDVDEDEAAEDTGDDGEDVG